jgi:hypothetical protein
MLSKTRVSSAIFLAFNLTNHAGFFVEDTMQKGEDKSSKLPSSGCIFAHPGEREIFLYCELIAVFQYLEVKLLFRTIGIIDSGHVYPRTFADISDYNAPKAVFSKYLSNSFWDTVSGARI